MPKEKEGSEGTRVHQQIGVAELTGGLQYYQILLAMPIAMPMAMPIAMPVAMPMAMPMAMAMSMAMPMAHIWSHDGNE